jgi:uncharacterized membrane protein YczE
VLAVPSRPELRRRLPPLLLGLVVFGVGIALLVRSGLGLGPWDVMHQGITNRTGVPIGTVGIGVGVVLLAAFPPLRERIGIGTIANTLVIGVVIDLTMLVLPDAQHLALQVAFMVGGILAIAIGSGAYIGCGLGPGPRDGLMTGLARVTGSSVRLVRTGIELTVLAIGVALGGTIGVGTVAFALAIGPLVQVFLARFSLPPLLPTNPVPADPHPPQ